MPIATRWACCPKRSTITCSGSAGVTATTRSSAASRRSSGSTCRASANRQSRFDLKKLENLNGHYIREADDARLADWSPARLGHDLPNGGLDLLRAQHAVLKPRAANLNELAEGRGFPVRQPPLEMDADAASLARRATRSALLAQLHAALDALDKLGYGGARSRGTARRRGRRASSSARSHSRFAPR